MRNHWIWLPALLLAFSASAADDALLLRSSFDGTRDADFARGDGRAVIPEALRRLPAGKTALELPWNQWLCYPAAGNLELAAGTIQMRVRLDFTPGAGTLPDGWTDGHLFCIRNRTGQRLNGLINDRSGFLFFYVSNEVGKTSSVKVDVRKWKAGEWRTVTFAWKRPGELFVGVEGLGSKSARNANLPDCPMEHLYDFYVGSNAQVLPIQQYGRLNTLRGAIDELRIWRDFRPRTVAALPELNLPEKTEKRLVASPVPAWTEARHRHRLLFSLGNTRRGWKNNPVRLPLDLSRELGALPLAGRRAAVDALRLVELDPATGRPAADGEAAYRAFQLDDDFLNRMSGALHFSHPGKLPALYALYFDAEVELPPVPRNWPLAGTGLPLMVGVKGMPGDFGGGLRGAFDLLDFDGDGDLDLWFISGSQTDSGRDLFGGFYYYENLRDRRGYDCFAAPVLIDKGNLELGFFRQTAPPRLVDLDGDGKPECVFASGVLPAWARIRNVNGRPELYDWKKLEFDGPLPKLVSSAAVADFNGDGLPDLFSDGECYFNIGSRGAPKFRSEPADLFAPGVRQEAEASTHHDVHAQKTIRNADGEAIRPLVWTVCDVDGDGRDDLVCGGWKSQIYYFSRGADGRFGAPKLLSTHAGHELGWPGVFPFPLFRDLDGDGAVDLVLSSEDGSLGFSRNLAAPGQPLRLAPPVSLPEMRPHLNGGALVVPVAVDWNGDGRMDVLAGGADGLVWYWENIGRSDAPVFRNPVALTSGGKPILIQAGPDGSVQGEQENDWGYLNIEVADWDGDGLRDLIVTGVRGEHLFFRNIGSAADPRLAPGTLIELDAPGAVPHPENIRFAVRGKSLVTVHRCRPTVVDLDRDGLPDYVTTDHRDRLAWYQRFRRPDGSLGLRPGRNIFTLNAPFFRTMIWNHQAVMGLPTKSAQEGRSVIQLIDWDGDGKLDLLMDNLNARWFRNTSDDPLRPVLVDQGDLAAARLANHNSAPYAADWDGDGAPDLIVGTESGWIYHFARPFLEKDTPPVLTGQTEKRP